MSNRAGGEKQLRVTATLLRVAISAAGALGTQCLGIDKQYRVRFNLCELALGGTYVPLGLTGENYFFIFVYHLHNHFERSTFRRKSISPFWVLIFSQRDYSKVVLLLRRNR